MQMEVYESVDGFSAHDRCGILLESSDHTATKRVREPLPEGTLWPCGSPAGLGMICGWTMDHELQDHSLAAPFRAVHAFDS
ncbi:MAG: hypothetical protein CMJ29_01880 [Phycisphaerae bacterium]|nr:hypothetical protein [Phycisphaerae bacterium]